MTSIEDKPPVDLEAVGRACDAAADALGPLCGDGRAIGELPEYKFVIAMMLYVMAGEGHSLVAADKLMRTVSAVLAEVAVIAETEISEVLRMHLTNKAMSEKAASGEAGH